MMPHLHHLLPTVLREPSWDLPKVLAVAEGLLDNAHDTATRAHLLATSTPESGSWLKALPLSSIGTMRQSSLLWVFDWELHFTIHTLAITVVHLSLT